MLQRLALTLLTCSLAVAATGQTKSPSTAPAKRKTASKTATATPGPPPTAIIHTTAGDLKCELFPDKAPKTVENFVSLAMGTKDWKNPFNGQEQHDKPLYDGVIFHRVIPGFMIQGGDPIGTGTGNPGYTFEDELLPDLLFDKPGRLAMANAGPNTNGSQFFITEKEQPALNPCLNDAGCNRGGRMVSKGTGYTIFGQCDDATVELVKKIAQGPCRGQICDGGNSRADNPVKISHIEILNPPKPAKPPVKHPTKKKTAATKTSQ
ncbi:MAG TPA: peptidylprolyl isomerase [Candidatus Angelobacter sp.]